MEQGQNTVQPRRVILLNGTSSAGKSTLARALQQALLPHLWYHLDDNRLRDTHPERNVNPPGIPKGVIPPSFLEAIPPALRSLAACGNNLIIDDVFGPAQLQNYVEVFYRSAPAICPFFVYVGGSQEVLDRREALRSHEREAGTARGLLRLVRAPGIFDREVDTTSSAPEMLAQQIVEDLRSHSSEHSAFARLAGIDWAPVIHETAIHWGETTFVNQSDQPRFAYLIDIWEKPQLRASIAPGENVTRSMSNSHPWEVRDEAGTVVLAFIPPGKDWLLILE